MSWNPSAPNTVGIEWPVVTEGLHALDASTRNAAPRIVSSKSESIDRLILPHRWAGPSSAYGRLWCDVYDMSASPVAETVTELSFKPNEDKAKSNVTKSDWASTSNLYAVIDDDDDSGPPEWTDYIINTNVGGVGTARFQFNTGSIPNTWRILYVKFELRCKGYDWSWQRPQIDLEWWNGSTQLGVLGRVKPPQDYRWRTYTLGPFWYDPYNEGLWLQPEIALLDNNTSRNVGLRLAYACAVSRLTMKVGVIPENRAAVGVSPKLTVPPSGLQTNVPITFKTPLNSDNWSKASGKTYALVVRRLEDPFSVLPTLTPQIAYLDSAEAPNPQQHGDAFTFSLADPSGRVTEVVSATRPTFAPVLIDSSGDVSVDSQPYHDLVAAPVYSGQSVRQGFDDASVQAYGRLKAVVAVASTPTDDLSFTVHKLSDNSQIGGEATLAPGDLADASIATRRSTFVYEGVTFTIYEVVLNLDTAATLAGSTDYYVQASSSTTSARPWLWLGVDATATHGADGNETYGGDDQQGYVDGTPQPNTDYIVTLSSVPGALSGLVGSVLSRPLPDNGGSECDPGDLHYAHVNWTSSALGAGFERYEVERSYDGGASWHAIAHITNEATSQFDDYELRRETPTLYRVRVVRSDRAAGEWAVLSTPLVAPSSEGVMLFVTNSDPALSTGYVTVGASNQYEFLSAGEVVFMRMHNRDYQAAFRPLEDRGIRWTFNVLVYVADEHAPGAPPDGEGHEAFRSLRAIAEADVPYIAMLTPAGQALYGTIQVPSGRRVEPGRYYSAPVTFTQTQREPTIVTV